MNTKKKPDQNPELFEQQQPETAAAPIIVKQTEPSKCTPPPVHTPEHKRPENLAQAVIQVMQEVKSIEKNMQIGEGKYSYKGIADKDVKYQIGSAMERAGLCILPIGIDPEIRIDRWQDGARWKQSILTEVKTEYLLLHESGESQKIIGYGHGIDAQDKSAGKATTYALKNALLYAFMVPTGTIDDADKTHSNNIAVPASKPLRKLTDAQFEKGMEAIDKGDYTAEEMRGEFQLTEEQSKTIKDKYNV